jgi:hypothetical protein
MGIVIDIQIELSCHPDQNGTLSVLDEGCRTILGPFPVAGKSCAVECAFGDTEQELDSGGISSGAYVVQDIHTMAGASLGDIREFGRYGIVALAPWVGEEPGTVGGYAGPVYMHGGALGADGCIRMTFDSMRLQDRHIHELVALLESRKDVTVHIRNVTEQRGLANPSSSDLVSAQCAGRLRGVLTALPLVFAGIPGLFAATAAAQEECTVYDTGAGFSQVDFSGILVQNGGDALAGYVHGPTSGVTIAGGLDLGIYTSSQLLAMGFPSTQVTEWAPYLASSCGSLVGSAATAVLNANPLSISSGQAQMIDNIYYAWNANSIASLYNQLVTQYNIIPGITFAMLPLRYQTAMTAMNLTNTSFGMSQAFLLLAQGQWKNATAALRAYGSSNAAINRLAHMYADYLGNSPDPSV